MRMISYNKLVEKLHRMVEFRWIHCKEHEEQAQKSKTDQMKGIMQLIEMKRNSYREEAFAGVNKASQTEQRLTMESTTAVVGFSRQPRHPSAVIYSENSVSSSL
ncbi:hypothetical protein Csa_008300 [Cucumis sativus]|uniref:Uncharacterized protein n=1 Tax=Cucumis sativus TaxID=3659 RepID=A0A0A0KT76_CUCSA|nr:hypothetical protein Csa_008300 [Cucumis sativus]